MIRVALGIVAAVLLLGAAAVPASAAESTEVYQGSVIRVVSVADWERAGRLAPGEAVDWTLDISASPPDPGTLEVGVRGGGELPVSLDAETCSRPWQGASCTGERTTLLEGWRPAGDGTTWIEEVDADRSVHLRLVVSRDDDAVEGQEAEVAVHVRGASEEIIVGEQPPPLAPTGGGPHPLLPAIVAGVLGAAIAATGWLRRGRERSG
ncbi:hypothetical protein [Microbacterium gilvum]|uniref:Uncharacterized protein n=1 Tax=Microbacterium gilvum TaxID=1336204 RepID=A0ABP9AIM5_9MICO